MVPRSTSHEVVPPRELLELFNLKGLQRLFDIHCTTLVVVTAMRYANVWGLYRLLLCVQTARGPTNEEEHLRKRRMYFCVINVIAVASRIEERGRRWRECRLSEEW